jgi:hypothetical protein
VPAVAVDASAVERAALRAWLGGGPCCSGAPVRACSRAGCCGRCLGGRGRCAPGWAAGLVAPVLPCGRAIVLAAAVGASAAERAARLAVPRCGLAAGHERAAALAVGEEARRRRWIGGATALERRRWRGQDRGGQEQPSRRRRPWASSLRRWSWRGGAAARYHNRRAKRWLELGLGLGATMGL